MSVVTAMTVLSFVTGLLLDQQDGEEEQDLLVSLEMSFSIVILQFLLIVVVPRYLGQKREISLPSLYE